MQQYAILHPEVQYTTKPQRVSPEDINNPNRAVYYWGRTMKQSWSDFVDYRHTDAFHNRESSRLNPDAFVNPGSGTRRQFYKGCFVRTAGSTLVDLPWWNNEKHEYNDNNDIDKED
jgi:hypothetical protein